ncbi:pirin family protein [Acinetobacter shaoyimingii]|uniref:Pirin family protein n=1 Tax=Acinetobacter shaoyimingii TaxID=2715164 RepID=A0A6G8RVH1_9GAMM|nr:pirin family protein [Acinetobacter shaoyimingii]QIO05877.1 pirin family protein [Acinetobacter shaoyimingii]
MAVQYIIDRRIKDLGGGFEVGRLLPFRTQPMVGPFIFFDHMGPVDLPENVSKDVDVRPHPHIGLSTVTYLFDGTTTHRDSLGVHQEIRPGEVNWMVAGSGITHSERFEYARTHGGDLIHGIQTWVALPIEDEETAPAFYHHEGADLPTWNDHDVRGRLIAGSIGSMKAAVKTFSPLFYMHWEMDAGATESLSNEYSERAIYVVSGLVSVDGEVIHPGQMAVLKQGETAVIQAHIASQVMALGGEPIGERFLYWNFVSSSKARLEQAKEDWRLQRMKLPVGDDQEFTPLP